MLLTPFDYHKKLLEHFQKDKKTWDWFRSYKVKAEQIEEYQQNLLKNTYRLTAEEYPEIYSYVDKVKQAFGIQTTVTVYQAPSIYGSDANAGISFFENNVHIVLSGQIIKLLDADEMLAVIAHELSHVLLFTIDDGGFETTDRIITAIANDARTEDEYIETARRFKLYMELFCDRGAYQVTQNYGAIITSLVKINVGLEKVSADNFVKQAEEIFAKGKLKTEGVTHPENFVRARAIHLLHTESPELEKIIKEMIEGDLELEHLDIFDQEFLEQITKEFLQLILKPSWIQTEAVLSLARQYFPSFVVKQDIMLTPEIVKKFEELPKSIKQYLCYVLLDFSLVDTSLENVPIGQAFQLAEDLGLREDFREVYKKEFKFSEKKLDDLQKSASNDLAKVMESSSDSIYAD
jgi:hypothetical protein